MTFSEIVNRAETIVVKQSSNADVGERLSQCACLAELKLLPHPRSLVKTDAGLRVLVVTTDHQLTKIFNDLCTPMGIAVEVSEKVEQLNRAKYAGIVLDLDTVPRAEDFWIGSQSNSNRYSLVLTVATDLTAMTRTLRHGAHFTLRRPLDAKQVARTLDAAYGALKFAYNAMLGERRRYFRRAASLTVRLRRIGAGTTIECSTANLSSTGMAVNCSASLSPAEALDIALTLPDTQVMGIGVVAWSQQGQVGIHFQCRNPITQEKLDSWLDREFEKKRSFQQLYFEEEPSCSRGCGDGSSNG